jgi:hypothetical protein
MSGSATGRRAGRLAGLTVSLVPHAVETATSSNAA